MGSSVQQSLVYAIHGFLGQSADWKNIVNQPSVVPDLFTKQSLPITELETYIPSLIQSVPASTGSRIFIGYSLGGRIGLNILDQNSELFDHYIFLSANPGLPDDALLERSMRLKNDADWASQITESNWKEFYQRWNAQKVFEGSNQEPSRAAQDFDLMKLRQALTLWSLAKQKDFSEVIRKNQNKITWVVGDQDSKYIQIANELKQKKILLDFKRISAGHRVWLDQPQAIKELLSQFVHF